MLYEFSGENQDTAPPRENQVVRLNEIEFGEDATIEAQLPTILTKGNDTPQFDNTALM